jgi:hypothetical protein
MNPHEQAASIGQRLATVLREILRRRPLPCLDLADLRA